MSKTFTFSQLWPQIKDVVWYKWTTWWNNRGDITRWVDETDPENIKHCKGMVRREDALIFQNTLSCMEWCPNCDIPISTKHRAVQDGFYLRGTDIFGTRYDKGRHL